MKQKISNMEFPLQLSDGREVTFVIEGVRENRPMERSFVFALHKSGSVLLNSMIKEVVDSVDIPFVDLPVYLFSNGIKLPEVVSGTADVFAMKGCVFGGFRHFPPPALEVGNFSDSKSILLVRDPRDILVSFYFSMLKSHAIPKSGAARDTLLAERERVSDFDIDEFVREKSAFVIKQFQRYERQLLAKHSGSCRLFRYEDVIFEKTQWLSDVCQWFGWNVDPALIEKVANAHDIRPSEENTDAHIRRVAPGDHREKLSEETIEWLNQELRETVAPFGYDLT